MKTIIAVLLLCSIVGAASVLRYVDPAAAGTGDGSSWTNAYTGLQSALSAVAAGDTVYCRGTETLSDTLEANGTTGAITSPVMFVGCNASGADDGTMYTVTANNALGFVMRGNGPDYYLWKNFKFKRSTSHVITFATGNCDFWAFYNCRFDSSGAAGIGVNANTIARYIQFVRCTFHANGNTGFVASGDQSRFYYCSFTYNGAGGGVSSAGAIVHGCLFHANGGPGVTTSSFGAISGSTFDANTGDNISTGNWLLVLNCRFTSATDSAIGGAGHIAVEDGNFAYGNTNGTYNAGRNRMNGPYSIWAGTSSGYINAAADNFALTDSAQNRRLYYPIGAR